MVLLAWSVPAEAGKKGRKKARDAAPAAEQQPEVEAVPQAEIGSVEVTEGVGEVVGLPCLWEAGVGLSYATTWESTIGGELAVRTASTTHTEVLEQGPPTVLRYMGDPDVTMEGKEEAVAAMAAASEGVGEMPMELVVDGGILTGIRNMDALSEGLDRMVANMTVGQPADAAAAIERTFASPEMRMAMLAKGPQEFLAMFCVQGQQDQSLTTVIGHPNPWGGEPIRGYSTVTFEKIDQKAGTMTLTTLDIMDDQALRQATIDAVRVMLPPDTDTETLEAQVAQAPSIQKELRGRFVMSLLDGFPISYEMMEIIGAKDGPEPQRVQTSTFERIVE